MAALAFAFGLGSVGCTDDNPPVGSISAPRGPAKAAPDASTPAKKGGKDAGGPIKERLNIER